MFIQSSASSSEGKRAKVWSKGMPFFSYSPALPKGTNILTGRFFVARSHSLSSWASFSFLCFMVQKIPMVSKMSEAMFLAASCGRAASSSAIVPKV